MSDHITIDFETRSRVDLRSCGTSVYARHESTEVLCLAYSIAGESVELWKPGDAEPVKLFEAIQKGLPVEGHNVFFERNIWRHVCHERMDWPDVPFDQWRCSMSACCRLTLPRSLEDAGKALALPIQKDVEGNRIMMRLCKPKKPSKKDPSEWDNDPAKFQRLYQYCRHDVKSEVAISGTLEPLTASELKVWQLDQRINLRGLAVDTDAVQDAIAVVDAAYQNICSELAEVTGGVITTAKQVAKIGDYIESIEGSKPEKLSKDVVAESLDRDSLDDRVRRVLELRRDGSKASTAKLKSMLARADRDGRVRGNLVYHGASTGRWAGAGIQPQNFTRGTLSASEIEIVHDLLSLRDPDALDLLLGPPLDCISSALRSMIVAEPGKRLLVCDFASIEARVAAWVSGQDDLIEAFREEDRGGIGVYCVMASRIYDDDAETIHEEAEAGKKTRRGVGKVAALGLQYGMGAKAFRRTAKLLAGVDIDLKFSKHVVKTYRKTNDKIAELWRSLNTAAIRAIETHQPHRVGRLEITCDSDWLRIKLPSGRHLHYSKPSLVEVVAPWSEGHVGEIIGPEELESVLEEHDIELGERQGDRWVDCDVPKGGRAWLQSKDIRSRLEKKEPKYINQIQFWGVGRNRKWGKQRTYGGCLTENVVQAIARDFLVEAMLRLERADYPIVATVHDEVISELEDDRGSLDEFERIMRQIPRWGRGCPIEVEGFEAKRYRK